MTKQQILSNLRSASLVPVFRTAAGSMRYSSMSFNVGNFRKSRSNEANSAPFSIAKAAS